jgi:hypothetical protein
MLWSELLTSLQTHLKAFYEAEGVELADVYLGHWSGRPNVHCVHLLRGNADFNAVEADGGYDQTLYVFNWVSVDPELVDYSDVNAGHRLGYERLALQELVMFKALRAYQHANGGVDFKALVLECNPDEFIPSFASCLTLKIRLWNEALCGG